MKSISVYDIEADIIERIAAQHDTTEAEVICTILDNLTDEEIADMF